MNIVENVTSRNVPKSNMNHFSWIIKEFYHKYLEKCKNEKVTPKFNHVLRYPKQILDYGTAVSHRTNRYEGKHQTLKEHLNKARYRKNIPLYLAERHKSFRCANRAKDTSSIKVLHTIMVS